MEFVAFAAVQSRATCLAIAHRARRNRVIAIMRREKGLVSNATALETPSRAFIVISLGGNFDQLKGQVDRPCLLSESPNR